jgi:hypothetical protein
MHEREAARQNAPGDSDASALAFGLLECRAGHGPTEAALVQRARTIGLLAAPSRKP